MSTFVNRWFAVAVFALCGVILIEVALPLLVEPSREQGQTRYIVPRTADGQPDPQGVWQAMSPAAANIEPHAASTGVPAGLGVVEGGTIPYLPAALAKRNENFKNRGTMDPAAKCLLPGVPRVTYMGYP